MKNYHFETSNQSYGHFYSQKPQQQQSNKSPMQQQPASNYSYRSNINLSQSFNQNPNSISTPSSYSSSSTSSNLYEEIINSKIGLSNLGNTCYMNACLQILIHCPIFIKHYLSQESAIKLKPISSQFFDLLINIVSTPMASYLSPQILKDNFDSIHPQFSSYGEHDSEEFCRIFLEDINSELNRVSNRIARKSLSQTGYKKALYSEFKKDFAQRESSIITDIFYNTFLHTFKCYCGNEIYSFANYIGIPIEINSLQNRQLLSDILKETVTKKDKVNFDKEKCQVCHMSNRTKITTICSLPQILVLAIQRYNNKDRMMKNNTEIVFEEKINLTELIDRECYDYSSSSSSSSTTYNLFGAINHIGSINSGHYYANIKIKGEWYNFDDSKVTKLKNIPFASSEVYILFYSKL